MYCVCVCVCVETIATCVRIAQHACDVYAKKSSLNGFVSLKIIEGAVCVLDACGACAAAPPATPIDCAVAWCACVNARGAITGTCPMEADATFEVAALTLLTCCAEPLLFSDNDDSNIDGKLSMSLNTAYLSVPLSSDTCDTRAGLACCIVL